MIPKRRDEVCYPEEIDIWSVDINYKNSRLERGKEWNHYFLESKKFRYEYGIEFP
jgi:hypothetical protein